MDIVLPDQPVGSAFPLVGDPVHTGQKHPGGRAAQPVMSGDQERPRPGRSPAAGLHLAAAGRVPRRASGPPVRRGREHGRG